MFLDEQKKNADNKTKWICKSLLSLLVTYTQIIEDFIPNTTYIQIGLILNNLHQTKIILN